MYKRALSLIICIIMSLSLVINTEMFVFSDDGEDHSDVEATFYEGSCGDSVIWTLDTVTGVLTVSGDGAMKNYSSSSSLTYAPWAPYASDIRSVVIEEGVTHIGSYAFVGCKSLESVSIPKSVVSMGKTIFDNCPALKSIYITDMSAWCIIDRVDGTAYSRNFRDVQYNLYLNGELVTDLVIPDSVTKIDNHAFWQIGSITTLVIPDSVLRIEKSAFCYCRSLTDVTLGNSVEFLDDYVFSSCDSLLTVTIPDSVKTIEDYVFSFGNTALNSVPNDNVTIRCYENSTAHNYAKNNSLKYELLCRHSFTEYTHVDADCSMGAHELAYCDNGCGATDIIIEEGAPLGHSFTKYVYDNNETCFSDGTTTALCDNGCGATDVRTIKGTKLEHSFTDYAVTQNITCTENGVKEACCDNGCGEKDVIIEEAKGHVASKSTVLEQPTYYFEGTKVQYCTLCKEVLSYEAIPMLIYKGFPDVWENAWYAEGVEYCFKHGYVLGSDDGTFKPNAELTREQFVTVLARVSGADLSKYTDSPFSDVNAKAWYGPAVIWASTEGLVKGLGDGSFGVGEVLNREQLAAILYRFAEYKGIDRTLLSDLSYCDDADEISEWAYQPCAWAIEAKLLGSTSETENLLSPKMTVTRAQMTKIFMSLDNIE